MSTSVVSRLFERLVRHAIKVFYRFRPPPRILKFSPETNKALLLQFGARIGDENVTLRGPLILHAAESGFHNLSVGNGCSLQGKAYLDLTGRITLEDNASLGPQVTIMTHNNYNGNDLQDTLLAHTCGTREVRIAQGSHVGARSIILMGVSMGPNTLILPNSMVNRDIVANSVAGGVPAKVIRILDVPENPQLRTD
jgi:acetyltransferase-like isoleucine patch superfamily enzyme